MFLSITNAQKNTLYLKSQSFNAVVEIKPGLTHEMLVFGTSDWVARYWSSAVGHIAWLFGQSWNLEQSIDELVTECSKFDRGEALVLICNINFVVSENRGYVYNDYLFKVASVYRVAGTREEANGALAPYYDVAQGLIAEDVVVTKRRTPTQKEQLAEERFYFHSQPLVEKSRMLAAWRGLRIAARRKLQQDMNALFAGE